MSDYSALFHLSALILLYLEGMENIVPNLLGSVGNKQPLRSRGGHVKGMQEHLDLLWMRRKLRFWFRKIFPGLDEEECEA